MLEIQGSGGKGGKGGGRQPVESPDDLQSRQYAKVLDLVSEGEIVGLINGRKSIFLNDTPLENPDGTQNFQGVVHDDSSKGVQSQNFLAGFEGVEAEIAVGVEVTKILPVTRTVSNTNVSAIRVTVGIPALSVQSKTNGDLSGSEVTFVIEVQRTGTAFIEVKADTIKGKTTSKYQRSYRISLTGVGPWNIRVRRVTEDSKSVTLSNKTFWESYTEIIESKLRYPNSALVALSVDAEHFSSVPVRGYEMKGLIVRVPTNYDPIARTYAGIWNGTFKLAWTNNPAWCFYDLITTKRYGLGNSINIEQMDKWVLYEISKHCDGLVDDGFGGKEPRFTCNLYLQTREEAYNVISSFASMFCSIAFWSGGAISTVQDSPADPVALFAPANVINGAFSYTGSSLKSRHTIALVSWNDPLDRYKQKIEYVEDTESVIRFGARQTEVVAIGCTSRGQAHRYGRRILYTERMETEVISFRTGLEGLTIMPGEVIQTTDPVRSGLRMGGRIISATAAVLTLDAPVSLVSGQTYTLWAVLPDGTVQSRPVTTLTTSPVSALTVAPAFTQIPQAMAVWGLSSNELVHETWRIISIAEVDEFQAEITALKYSANKYAEIEQGIVLQALPTTTIKTTQDSPTNLTITESTYPVTPGTLATRLTVSWLGNGAVYELRYRRGADNWKSASSTSTSLDIDAAQAGTYQFSLVAVSAIGRRSRPIEATKVVMGLITAPLAVTGLAFEFTSTGIVVKWDKPLNIEEYNWLTTKIVVGDAWLSGVTRFDAKATMTNLGWLAAGANKVWAAHISLNGTSGEPSFVVVEVLAPAQPIVVGTVWRNEVTLTWQNCVTSQPLRTYRVLVGATFATALEVSQINALTFVHTQPVRGLYTYWVTAIDAAGNQGIPGYVQATVLPGIDEAIDILTRGLDVAVRDIAYETNLLKATDAFDASVAAVQLGAEIVARIDAVSAEASTRAAAILAEATARGTAITNVNTLRQQGDDQLALTVSTLTSTVTTNKGSATSAVQDESLARTNAIAAEAASRATLASQFRGSYEGSDLNAVTTGLFFQERLTRSDAVNALSQQITLLSAGSGEQFDHKQIWYFDSTVEGWTGGGVPTVSGGFLVPADSINTTHSYISSPSGLDINGATYQQVRFRVRKVGAPAWLGQIWYRRAGELNDPSRVVTVGQPVYDANGIGLVTATISWTGIIDGLSITLSEQQTPTNRFTVDWIAVGRPSPGASAADLFSEQTVRASADSAEVLAREALAVKLVGKADTTGLTLASLTTGLVFEERNTRVTESVALSTKVDGVISTATNDRTTSASAVTAEAKARSDNDTAISGTLTALTATVTGNNTAQAAAVVTEKDARVLADGAIAKSVDNLVTATNTDRTVAAAAVVTEAKSRTDGDTANASLTVQLQSSINSAGTVSNRVNNPTFSKVHLGLPQGWNVYNNSGAAEPTTIAVMPGADGYNAVRVSWQGSNTSTKGIAQTIKTDMRANVWYVLAVKIRATSQTEGSKMVMWHSGAPAFSSYTVIKDPIITGEWQWYVAKGMRTAGGSSELYISILGGSSVGLNSYEICQPTIHEGEVFSGFNEGPLEAFIQSEALTRASQTGPLLAKYSLTVSAGGKVTGFRINNDTSAGTDFTILADRFAVVQESAGIIKYPFTIGTIDGVSSIGINANMFIKGSVKADTIDAQAVTAEKILSKSITALQIKAGTITADLINVGFSVNLIDNSAFAHGLTNWEMHESVPVNTQVIFNLPGWFPAGGSSVALHQPNTIHDGSTHHQVLVTKFSPAESGKRYEFSVYTGAHRCTCYAILEFYNASNTLLSSVGSNANSGEASGGKGLSAYKRVQGFSTAPAGTVAFRLILVKFVTALGQPDSYGFFTNTFVAEAGVNQLTASSWSLGGSGTKITGAGISTPSLEAISGVMGNLSAGSVRGGAFTGYAWPANGAGGGYYLGPQGLLLGNGNEGKYFQVAANGNMYSPAMDITDGVMSLKQLNVVNTVNIAGNSVSTMAKCAGPGAATNIYVPAGQTMSVVGFINGYVPSVRCILYFDGVAVASALASAVMTSTNTGDTSTYVITHVPVVSMVQGTVDGGLGRHVSISVSDGHAVVFGTLR